jgi:hypothetical protein
MQAWYCSTETSDWPFVEELKVQPISIRGIQRRMERYARKKNGKLFVHKGIHDS